MATLVYKSFYVAAEGFEFVRIEPLKPRCLKRVEGERDSDRYWLIQADTHLFSTKLSHAVSIF